MEIKAYIDKVRGKRTLADIARATGQSPQCFHNKLRRGSMTTTDLDRVADALGCDVKFVNRETGEVL